MRVATTIFVFETIGNMVGAKNDYKLSWVNLFFSLSAVSRIPRSFSLLLPSGSEFWRRCDESTTVSPLYGSFNREPATALRTTPYVGNLQDHA